MKKALILHAWYGSPEADWYPWLKNELEKKGCEVWLPELPTMPTKSPDMETMLQFILDKKFVDQDTVVIGHSLGSVLAMRLAERIPFKMAILLAGWDYNDLTPEHQSFWTSMMDHTKIKENVKSWKVLISDNDPYVTPAIAEEMTARLGGKSVRVGKKGHFLTKDGITHVPEILEFV